MIQLPKEAKTGHYEHDNLFGCCSDIGSSCKICLCWCCAEGHLWADIRGEPCTVCYSAYLCPCCYHHPMWTRANVRHARGMPESHCVDCLLYCFCTPCAACQDDREIQTLKALAANYKPEDENGGGASVVVVNNNNNNNNNNMMMMGGAPPPQPGYAPPPQGYAPPPQGYPPQGAPPSQGYAPPPQGYPPQGPPPPQGYAPPPQGYAPPPQ